MFALQYSLTVLMLLTGGGGGGGGMLVFIKLIDNVLFYVCMCPYDSTCILLCLWTPWKNRIILLMILRWAIHPFYQF